jgi:DNA-directed RNA polymerase III subunit RPC11
MHAPPPPACPTPVQPSAGSGMRFYCQTCPYVQNIGQAVVKKLPLTRKKVDDVLGGVDAWKNVDQTEAPCPACGHNKAYFMQIQIRSADEPMTIFYKCTACAKMWSSN